MRSAELRPWLHAWPANLGAPSRPLRLPYRSASPSLIPSGQSTTGEGRIGVTWFNSGDCTSGIVLGNSFPAVTATGSFVTVTRSLVAPPGTNRALVFAVHAPSSNATHIVNFDDITLDDGAPTPIPTLHRSALLALIVALALTGVFTFNR